MGQADLAHTHSYGLTVCRPSSAVCRRAFCTGLTELAPRVKCAPSGLCAQTQITLIAAGADLTAHHRLADRALRFFVVPAAQAELAASHPRPHLRKVKRQFLGRQVP